jgi:hypothetical protein
MDHDSNSSGHTIHASLTLISLPSKIPLVQVPKSRLDPEPLPPDPYF